MLQIKDISIAKNYLNDEELKILNNIVSGYFDFAEIQAMRHNPMHMADYVEHLDNVLKTTGEKVLQGAGTISHAQAIEKATEEYRKYQVQNLSPVEEEYLENIINIQSMRWTAFLSVRTRQEILSRIRRIPRRRLVVRLQRL